MGAERGDVLVACIEDIEVADYSWLAIGPKRGPFGESTHWPELSSEYTTKIFKHTPGPSGTMRDGTLLATDVYLPAAPGRYPVILLRTPYGQRLGQGCFEGSSAGMAFWAENGYAAVSQDARGTFRSEGTFRPFFQEQADGYDAVEWAAAQAWSDGKVGMSGSSYMGVTQWQAAVTTPPHLVAIAPGQTAIDYHDHWTYVNGVFDLWFAQSWPLAFFADGQRTTRASSERRNDNGGADRG